MKTISDAEQKYSYILAMSMKLQPGGNLVRVAPSSVHGLGVFAAADIPKHTCCTVYPIDMLVLHEEASQPGLCAAVVFSQTPASIAITRRVPLVRKTSSFLMKELLSS